jgi:hypothetical protein
VDGKCYTGTGSGEPCEPAITYDSEDCVAVCDGDGVCEAGETQEGCSSDCNTKVSLPSRYVMPGQKIKIKIEFTDGRIDCTHDFQLNYYIDGSVWEIEDSICHGKKMSEFGWPMGEGEWSHTIKCKGGMHECEKEHSDEEINLTIYCEKYRIIVEHEAYIPEHLVGGVYTISITPILYSPIELNSATSSIIVIGQLPYWLIKLVELLRQRVGLFILGW